MVRVNRNGQHKGQETLRTTGYDRNHSHAPLCLARGGLWLCLCRFGWNLTSQIGIKVDQLALPHTYDSWCVRGKKEEEGEEREARGDTRHTLGFGRV